MLRMQAFVPNQKLANFWDQPAFRQQLLTQIATHKKISNLIRKHNWVTTESQKREALKSIKFLWNKDQFLSERFNDYLSKTHLQEQDFVNALESEALYSDMRHALFDTRSLLPYQKQSMLHTYKQVRHYQWAKVHCEPYRVSQAEIKDYYQLHQDLYQKPAALQMNYIVLEKKAYRAHPSIMQLKQYYRENQALYTRPATYQVQRLSVLPTSKDDAIKKVPKGWSSPGLSALLSSGSWHLVSGKPQWQVSYSLPQAVAEQFAHAHKGAISMPISTGQGYEIYRLYQSKPVHVQAWARVAEEVRKHWVERETLTRYKRALSQLNNAMSRAPHSLKVVADLVGTKMYSSKLIANPTDWPAVFAAAPKLQQAVRAQAMDAHQSFVPQSWALDSTHQIVYQVTSYREAKALPMKAVRPKIVKALQEKHCQEASFAKAKRWQADLQSGKENPNLAWKSGVVRLGDQSQRGKVILHMAPKEVRIVSANGQVHLLKMVRISQGQISHIPALSDTPLLWGLFQESLIKHGS